MFSSITNWAKGSNPKLEKQNADVLVKNALAVMNCVVDGEKLEGGYKACLEARYLPNTRLIRVFGLNNAFTTKDEARAREFRKEASLKINKVKNEEWKEYVNLSLESAATEIKKSGTELNLANLVQSVTLKVSLKFLFDLDTSVLKEPGAAHNVSLVAKEINRLWQASKTAGETTDIEWENQGSLHEALHALLDRSKATSSGDPDLSVSEKNPMNWILPAYETMWRVVLRGLVEVRFRSCVKVERQEGWIPAIESLWRAVSRGLVAYFYGAAEDKEKGWLQALDSFIDDLNQSPSPDKVETAKCSARHIALECLRLYPPTRRIDRQFPDQEHVAKADIEAIQRLPLLAEDRPLTFDPNRWVHIEDKAPKDSEPGSSGAHKFVENKGFAPFGAGKFQCPADMTNFGWKMIALLVGTLSRSLEGDWKVVGGILPPVGQALKSGREDCCDLILKKD
ncbi:hypothetical protein BLS_007284 [Venturia inaequalis]|uniref:Cytochrome P450 n=1 Tax=Venturia inaequalis TaxID=5025 RepID=A0A8H3ZFN6_VENIN|nr:hypothetical protein BLS_007284 [Venturia inaequalis]KAE9994508.1 hypothetical protein EG327_009186 [Venturia inaequalis]